MTDFARTADDLTNVEDLRRLHDSTTEFEVLPPLHPGEILRESFMEPLSLSAGAVAKALDLPRSRIERIAREEIGISTDTALRLARYFGTTHQFWLNLQTRFESEVLMSEIGSELDQIAPIARSDMPVSALGHPRP
ncbi:HigA family addiction module antitoxin [Methylobacterium sp. WL116]|uniref:HigA family addiction module antitoxin n=1 Tax=Methylobacterium sp. WL116 TaxID=2603889 RepID=UPI0011CC7BFF|nr:HigA family addiction module antidote protein [Methylobacterium sp. WL116]